MRKAPVNVELAVGMLFVLAVLTVIYFAGGCSTDAESSFDGGADAAGLELRRDAPGFSEVHRDAPGAAEAPAADAGPGCVLKLVATTGTDCREGGRLGICKRDFCCTGCWHADGTCRPGNVAGACGALGHACVDCDGPKDAGTVP